MEKSRASPRHRSSMRHLAPLIAFSLLAGACSHEAAPTPAPTPAPAAPRTGETSPPPPPVASNAVMDELKREAADRPTGTPAAEAVLDLFESNGLALLRRTPVLATPVHAHYCAIASTKVGLSMSICEFDSEAAAKAGRETSLQVFKSIPNRTLLLNGKTMLTLILPQDTDAIRAQRDKARTLFAQLSAK
jgi:hypothetical protein